MMLTALVRELQSWGLSKLQSWELRKLRKFIPSSKGTTTSRLFPYDSEKVLLKVESSYHHGVDFVSMATFFEVARHIWEVL